MDVVQALSHFTYVCTSRKMSDPTPRGQLNSKEPLPLLVSQLTIEWCSRALGSDIHDLQVLLENHGTASKIIIELKYSNDDSKSLPQRLCFKGGFNPPLIAAFPVLYLTYRREAEFYYYIAPKVEMRLPEVYFTGTDVDPGQGIVAMEDLTVRDCTFGTPLEPWPVERVRTGVRELAALHANTWVAVAERFPWLYASDNPVRGMVMSLFGEEAWAVRFAEGEKPPLPEHMTDRTRMSAAFAKMYATAPKHVCAIHGDPHIGNTFITAQGEPGFLDWQGLSIGSPFHDLAYFVSGSLAITDRRESEDRLLAHYLESLHALGGPKLDKAEAWEEYRKYTLQGFAWAIAGPQMQPKDLVFVMAERNSAAIMDHQSIELWESQP
jgi:hypothetical protein